MLQGNNIRENPYNPCSKNSVGKTNTFLNEHGLDGLNGVLFSNKNYIPQGNNIRENPYNPCSKNSVGKANTFKANTD